MTNGDLTNNYIEFLTGSTFPIVVQVPAWLVVYSVGQDLQYLAMSVVVPLPTSLYVPLGQVAHPVPVQYRPLAHPTANKMKNLAFEICYKLL